MESWKTGRRDLFDQLTKLCNRIGEDLEAELNNETQAQISKEELRLLRENSKQVEQLVEHNARLADELERCRDISSRVDGLEKENKRLAGELGQRLKQQLEIGTPKPRTQTAAAAKATPGSSAPLPSSAFRTEDDGSVWVPWEKHAALIKKYNKTCESYEDCKDAKKKLDVMLEAEREKIRNWLKWSKDLEKTADQRKEKIQRLEEEIQRMCVRSTDQRERSTEGFEEDMARERKVSEQPFSQMESSEVEVPVSPIKRIRIAATAKETGGSPRPANYQASLDPPILEDTPDKDPLTQNFSQEYPEEELPAHRVFAAQRVEDTQFEPIELHHTSSTEDTDPLTPNKEAREPRSEKEPEVPVLVEAPDSPGIEFISARSVKKRKPTESSTQPKIKTEIKGETISSSPIGMAAFRIQNPNESLDLDDIGEKVETPRKQGKSYDLSREVSRSTSFSPQAARLQSQLRQQGAATDAEEESTQETPVHRTSSILQPRSTNRQILPRTSDNRLPKKRRIASDEAIGELVEDGEIGAALETTWRQTSNTYACLDDLLSKPSPPRHALSSARLGRSGNEQARPARTPAPSGLAREYQRSGDRAKRQFQEFRPSSWNASGRASAEVSRPSSKSSTLRGSAEPSRPSSKGTSRGSVELSRPTSKGQSMASVEPPRNKSPVTTSLAILKGNAGLSQRSIQLLIDSGFESIESLTYTPLKILSLINGISEQDATKILEEAKKFRSIRSKLFPLVSTGAPKTSSISDETPSHLPPRRPPLSATISKKQALKLAETPKAQTRILAQSTKKSTLKRTRAEASADDWEMDPDQEPLRARPLNRLSLTDFKINPNYNQGHKHQFNEVIRGQEARQCLQGCTKPECCGNKFRALAESNRNPNMPRTLSQEEADDMLLDNFLGDNAYKRQTMSKVEREEMIIQAKTREMANKFGRHRHFFERTNSPPGFWRADFPTTQEEEEDRMKAKERERASVEERYREAMRPGGRFMFRDE